MIYSTDPSQVEQLPNRRVPQLRLAVQLSRQYVLPIVALEPVTDDRPLDEGTHT